MRRAQGPEQDRDRSWCIWVHLGLPPWLVVPVIRSRQSSIWIWLENYLHLHLHPRVELRPQGQHRRPAAGYVRQQPYQPGQQHVPVVLVPAAWPWPARVGPVAHALCMVGVQYVLIRQGVRVIKVRSSGQPMQLRVNWQLHGG